MTKLLLIFEWARVGTWQLVWELPLTRCGVRLKLKLLAWFIILCGLFNLTFAYDYPCRPPFLAISEPYSLIAHPNLLHFSEQKFAFAFEIAAGEYSFVHLFPWPRIQGYGHYRYKNFDGSIAIIDKYQFTTREKIDYTSAEGENLGKGYWWESQFIYGLRTGISYSPFTYFVIGFGGDLNRGVDRYDFEPPSEDKYHIQYAGYSTSYCLGLTILSQRRKPILSIGYDSRVNVGLNDSLGNLKYHNLIPAQLSVSLNFSMANMEIGIDYYYRFSEYLDFDDSLKIIKTNDFMIDFLIPISEAKFYLGCYTFSLDYALATKGFGIRLGPKLPKARFLNEFLILYERSEAKELGIPWELRMTRYGVRLGFAF